MIRSPARVIPDMLELTDRNFNATVAAHPIVAIDFWAPWCGQCRAFAPVFEDAARAHPDLLFAKVNADLEEDLVRAFGVTAIPTVLVFRDNILVFQQSGQLRADVLRDVLAQARALDMDRVRAEAHPYKPGSA